MKDRIYLENVESFCRLGIYENERLRGQCIKADLIIELDLAEACSSDDFKYTISYVELSHIIQETAQAKEYWLIEHLCEETCNNILGKFPQIEGVDLRIYKPVINAEGFIGNASVRIYRSQN